MSVIRGFYTIKLCILFQERQEKDQSGSLLLRDDLETQICSYLFVAPSTYLATFHPADLVLILNYMQNGYCILNIHSIDMCRIKENVMLRHRLSTLYLSKRKAIMLLEIPIWNGCEYLTIYKHNCNLIPVIDFNCFFLIMVMLWAELYKVPCSFLRQD